MHGPEILYDLTDTADDTASPNKLTKEIRGSGITATVSYVDVTEDEIKVVFGRQIDDDEKETLDGVIALHEGSVARCRYITTARMFHDPFAITIPNVWTDIATAPTSIGTLIPEISRACGRVVFEANTNASGAKLRVVERAGEDETVLSDEFTIPDTDGGWTPMSFPAMGTPTAGLNVYILQCKATLLVSASVRSAFLSLLEMEVL